MSRIGKLPIKLSNNVKISVSDEAVTVTGPLGPRVTMKPKTVSLYEGPESIQVICEDRAMLGTFRKLLVNSITGVSESFKRTLKRFGIRYELENVCEHIRFKVGFSHKILWEKKLNVKYTVVDKVTLSLFGIQKCIVMHEAASLRYLNKPEAYDGKGLRYEDEVLKLKEKKKL